MWFLVLWGLGIVTAGIQFLLNGVPGSTSEICSVVLLHQFAVTFGIMGIIGIISNLVLADKNANMLGWPGGPFQIKYGFSQLGIGVMGVMAIWFRGNFWAGVLVTIYVYAVSGLWTHTLEMIKNGKPDAMNVGNIIMCVTHQIMLTWLSIEAGGVWCFN